MSMPKLKDAVPRNSRPSRSEVRRRLIDAAAEVFAAKGYTASSVDDVARQAGLTKGAVYSNFESKDELFFALLGEQVAARIALVEALPATPEPAEAWLRSVGAALTRAMVEEPGWHLLFIEFWQRSIRDPAARERFVPHRRELHDLVSRTIAGRAQELKLRLPVEPDRLATAMLGLSNGLAIEYMLDPDSVPPDLLGDLLVSMIDSEL
jgi:AcrR family transcriptional regulator